MTLYSADEGDHLVTAEGEHVTVITRCPFESTCYLVERADKTTFHLKTLAFFSSTWVD